MNDAVINRWLRQSAQALRRGRPNDAVKYCQCILAEYPDEPAALNNLAQAYLALGELALAEAALHHCLAVDGAYALAHGSLAEVYMAQAREAYHNGDTVHAKERSQRLLMEYPDSPAAAEARLILGFSEQHRVSQDESRLPLPASVEEATSPSWPLPSKQLSKDQRPRTHTLVWLVLMGSAAIIALAFWHGRQVVTALSDVSLPRVHGFVLQRSIDGSSRLVPAAWMGLLRSVARNMPRTLTIADDGDRLVLSANEVALDWDSTSETGGVLAYYVPTAISPVRLGQNPSVNGLSTSTLQFFSSIGDILGYDAQDYLEQAVVQWTARHTNLATSFPSYVSTEALISQNGRNQIEVWLPQAGDAPTSEFNGRPWSNTFNGFLAQMVQWLQGTR